MRKFTLLLSLIILLITSGFLLLKEARAGTGENVSGFAWSENIKWISFNSLNCDPNGDGNPSDGPADCVEPGRDYSINPIPNYGVNVDPDPTSPTAGEFSGHAWSEHIGWIWFAPTDTTPDGTVNPATLNLTTNEVSGWARACAGAANADCTGGVNPDAGGWDGWIKLSGTNYGVWLDTSVNPNEFRDWAWGGDDTEEEAVIGWTSFNCLEGGDCLTSDYKVFIVGPVNLSPSATSLNVTQGNYCFISSPPIFLNWTYSDPDDTDPQSAYQIQVDDESGFNPPLVVDTKVLSDSNSYALPGLSFGTPYYWRVMVWDSSDTPSIFAAGPSFSTLSRPPWPDFTWSPPEPAAGEIIQFTDQTTFYGTGPGWEWDFDGDGGTDSIEQNPTHSYSVSGDYIVELIAVDSNGSCALQQTLTTGFPLPEWREIAPTGLLEKFWASIFSFFQA